MSPFSQSDLVQVSREVETTPGVVDGGARTRIYGTQPAFSPGGNTLKSNLITGEAAIKAVRAGLRFCDFNLPTELVFGLHDVLFEDFFRMATPGAEVEATSFGAGITFANAGTQLDGSTGPILTVPGTEFAAFNTANAPGSMLEIVDSGLVLDAANRWPRLIKDCSDGQIDLDPAFVTGAAGKFGEPLTDEGPLSPAKLTIGKVVKNVGPQDAGYVDASANFQFDYTDQPGGSFFVVKGCYGNVLNFGITGKGIVTVEFGYLGMDFDDLATATAGTVGAAPTELRNDSMTAGEDLAYAVINGSTVVSQDNLTSLTIAGTGSAQGIDDTSGSRFRVGVTRGDIDFTGGLNIYHEHTKMAVAVALARAGNRVPLVFKIQDPAGNYYWGSFPKVLFGPGGPVPGAKGSLPAGAFSFETQLGTGRQRTFHWQKFAAA